MQERVGSSSDRNLFLRRFTYLETAQRRIDAAQVTSYTVALKTEPRRGMTLNELFKFLYIYIYFFRKCVKVKPYPFYTEYFNCRFKQM